VCAQLRSQGPSLSLFFFRKIAQPPFSCRALPASSGATTISSQASPFDEVAFFFFSRGADVFPLTLRLSPLQPREQENRPRLLLRIVSPPRPSRFFLTCVGKGSSRLVAIRSSYDLPPTEWRRFFTSAPHRSRPSTDDAFFPHPLPPFPSLERGPVNLGRVFSFRLSWAEIGRRSGWRDSSFPEMDRLPLLPLFPLPDARPSRRPTKKNETVPPG